MNERHPPEICPYCPKPLRADNTRGACHDCISSGKAPKRPAEPSAERRFRAACRALGLDMAKEREALFARWLTEHAR